MTIPGILIWEATNALLLIPMVIALVMGDAVDAGGGPFSPGGIGLFLFGHPRDKLLSLHLWIRFAVLWFTVVLIRGVEGYVLLPFGLAPLWGRFFSPRL